ncbi:MAG: hypothetical protein J7578_19275 [Chitinophagaceae bacterium]|nr:hypothetical protein [Chitinophagaceae bacterium]
MRIVLLLTTAALFFSCSKKNKDGEGGGCGDSPYIPPQAFSGPVWHPGGQIFSFTYLPIAGIITTPCLSKRYEIKSDSVGQYFLKKDGSSLTRSLAIPFFGAAWSRDGNRFAWLEAGNVYLTDFNNSTMAVSNKQLLYQGSVTGIPMFNATGDSLYLHTMLSSTYAIRSVALDASGSKEIKQGNFRELTFGSNNRFYYTNNQMEILSMDKDGNDIRSEVAGDPNQFRVNLRYHDGNIYYAYGGKLVRAGNNTPLVDAKVTSFAISPQGEIIYNQFSEGFVDDNKQNGTFWIMNADGSNKRQLTYNHY